MTVTPDGWNHNIHYHPVVLGAVPADGRRALDVGCGEGILTRQLTHYVPQVVGIDRDPTCIRVAREHPGPAIDYVLGDVLEHPFKPESFDFVVSVAFLHHVDVETGLTRMSELLRPGGRLAVIGLGRNRQPVDLPLDVVGVTADRLHKLSKTERSDGVAPQVWPPPLTFGQTRRAASRVLPGMRYRRHLLWRYSLTWIKPPRSEG